MIQTGEFDPSPRGYRPTPQRIRLPGSHSESIKERGVGAQNWPERKTELSTTGFLGDRPEVEDSFATLRDGSHNSMEDTKRKSSSHVSASRAKSLMTTGCIPCLILGIPCDPDNPGCKLAISAEWSANRTQKREFGNGNDEEVLLPGSTSPFTIRLDTTWGRNWRERHSINFFATFSAPQMNGFFDSGLWSQCIRYSYLEPVILHALSAIGSLHESILQGAFQDEKRKAQAIEFSLTQCNRSIGYLMDPNRKEQAGKSSTLSMEKLALMACVLFTCFESLQGHCDSAVKHALQGKTLMEAHYNPQRSPAGAEEDDVEVLRTIVERLEVQATALVDRRARGGIDDTNSVPPLPAVNRIRSLDHAHLTLHAAMNNNMRYSQRFHPDASADHHAISHAKKTLRYAPWYEQWEAAFSRWLSQNHDTLTNLDRKRAMVLKANQLVGTMLATVDQRAGPAAYDRFESEFRAIVELSREVLTDFPCPPLPTLTAGNSSLPYFSCSLWVTDPLFMAVSRCRNPGIRQAAFALLRQNPRQEGIWHGGPQISNQLANQTASGSTSQDSQGSNSTSPSRAEPSESPPVGDATDMPLGEVPDHVSQAEEAGNMRERSRWIDSRTNVQARVSEDGDVSDRVMSGT